MYKGYLCVIIPPTFDINIYIYNVISSTFYFILMHVISKGSYWCVCYYLSQFALSPPWPCHPGAPGNPTMTMSSKIPGSL